MPLTKWCRIIGSVAIIIVLGTPLGALSALAGSIPSLLQTAPATQVTTGSAPAWGFVGAYVKYTSGLFHRNASGFFVDERDTVTISVEMIFVDQIGYRVSFSGGTWWEYGIAVNESMATLICGHSSGSSAQANLSVSASVVVNGTKVPATDYDCFYDGTKIGYVLVGAAVPFILRYHLTGGQPAGYWTDANITSTNIPGLIPAPNPPPALGYTSVEIALAAVIAVSVVAGSALLYRQRRKVTTENIPE